jgi:hypothetical protein
MEALDVPSTTMKVLDIPPTTMEALDISATTMKALGILPTTMETSDIVSTTMEALQTLHATMETLEILLNELPDPGLELYLQQHNKFELFAHFPEEIRCMIWEASLPVGRTVQLGFVRKQHSPDYPAILHATCESRQVTLKHFYVERSMVRQVDGSTLAVGKMCINPSSDRVLISNFALLGGGRWKMVDCRGSPWAGKVTTIDIEDKHWCKLSLVRFLMGWYTTEDEGYPDGRPDVVMQEGAAPALVPPEIFLGLKMLRLIASHPQDWTKPWKERCLCADEPDPVSVKKVRAEVKAIVPRCCAHPNGFSVPDVDLIIASPRGGSGIANTEYESGSEYESESDSESGGTLE